MNKEKELLRKQLELLSEQSKGATDREIYELSIAMSSVYESLTRPTFMAALLAGFAVMETNFMIACPMR